MPTIETVADLDSALSDLSGEVATLTPAIIASITATNALINALSTAGATKDLTPEVTQVRSAQAGLIAAVKQIGDETSTENSALNGSGGTTNTSGGTTLPLTFGNTPPIAVDLNGDTLYQFTGVGTPDPTVWTLSGDYVDSTGNPVGGEPLYTFSGDTAPGQINGVQAGWATVPQPA